MVYISCSFVILRANSPDLVNLFNLVHLLRFYSHKGHCCNFPVAPYLDLKFNGNILLSTYNGTVIVII